MKEQIIRFYELGEKDPEPGADCLVRYTEDRHEFIMVTDWRGWKVDGKFRYLRDEQVIDWAELPTTQAADEDGPDQDREPCGPGNYHQIQGDHPTNFYQSSMDKIREE